jgi:hypothetical protein
MILIDFFSEDCCKGTELVEGWYWYDDDDENAVGGPFTSEEAALRRLLMVMVGREIIASMAKHRETGIS